MKQHYTYLHCKPDLTPFYVGKGSGKRSHNFTQRNRHHQNVVLKYGAENIVVIVFKKESEEAAFKSEIRLIKMLRNAGFELTNYTDGGEGASGKITSLEVRAKISNSHFGIKPSKETRARMSESRKGRVLSAETRKKMSLAALGKPKTIEHAKNAGAAQRGKPRRPLSAEHRAKIALANIGRISPNKGKYHSLESRKKMSLSAKNAWEKRKVSA